MMKKRLYLVLALSVIVMMLMPIAAMASDISSALWRGIVTVSNNGTATANSVSVNMSLSSSGMVDNSYASANLTDIAIQINGVDTAFMPGHGSNPWAIWVPSISGLQNLRYDLYSGGASGGKIRYFPGSGGMTTSDNDTLELGDNFTIEQSGWIDTSYSPFPIVAAVGGGNNTADTANHTVSLPSGIVASNLLIVIFSADATPTITFPSGWTQLFQAGAGNVRFGAWYRIADGTEAATIIVTTSSAEASAHTSYRITDYYGVPEAGTAVTGSSANPDPPSLTPSWGTRNTLWLAVTGYDVGTATVSAYPTSYTDGRNDRSNLSTGVGVGSARRFLNATSENPGTFTLSTTPDWVANTIAVLPKVKFFVQKPAAFETFISGSGNITSQILGTSANVTATGVSSGEHTVITRQTVNLLVNNADFEDGGTPPTGWVLWGAGGSSDTDTVTKRINASSANLTRNGADCMLYQTVADYTRYAGKTVTLGSWVYATVADTARLEIKDDGDSLTASSYHTGVAGWEWLTITHTVSATPVQLRGACWVTTGNTTAYFDAIVLVEGSDFEDFEGNMLSNWSFELGDPPTDWTLLGAGATVSRSAVEAKIGTYSTLLTRNGSDCSFYQAVSDYTQYRGEKVTIGLWIYATVASRGRFNIWDGVGVSNSDYHTGVAGWEWLTVTRIIDSGADRIWIRAQIIGGDTSVYFDGAILVEGETVELDVTKRIDHLQILVDGTWHDSAYKATVPDNSNDWTFLQNDVMPYMEYHKIWVSGTLQQHIVWEYGSTFSDQSGNDHDATPTFRTESSNAYVSAVLSGFEPTSEAKLDTFSLTADYEILTENITMPSQMYGELDTSRIPGGEAIDELLEEGGVPKAAWWFPFMFIGICVIGLITYGATTLTRGGLSNKITEGQVDGSLLFMFIMMEIPLAIFGIMRIIPFWPALMFPIAGGAIIMSRKHFSWG